MSTPSEIPFQTLLEALLDEDTPVSPRYLYRLSDLEPDEMALLKTSWPLIPIRRWRALLEDLEELGNADDLLSFESVGRHALTDEDSQVRLLGVHLLWEFEAKDLVPAFLRLMESDPEVDVRAAAATALGQYVYLGEIDQLPQDKLQKIQENLLEVIVQDSDPLVRRRALESIAFSSHEEVAPLIEWAFASGDHEWMASALLAMGRSMDERWEEPVLTMLDHHAPTLRAEAARAAGELELSEALTHLVELTRDGDEDVRAAAIWSLSQIGGDRARRTLENLLRRAKEEDEADFLESALDNLAFNDGLEAFSLLDLPEEEEEPDDFELFEDEGFLDYDDSDDGEFLDINDYDEDEDLLD